MCWSETLLRRSLCPWATVGPKNPMVMWELPKSRSPTLNPEKRYLSCFIFMEMVGKAIHTHLAISWETRVLLSPLTDMKGVGIKLTRPIVDNNLNVSINILNIPKRNIYFEKSKADDVQFILDLIKKIEQEIPQADMTNVNIAGRLMSKLGYFDRRWSKTQTGTTFETCATFCYLDWCISLFHTSLGTSNGAAMVYELLIVTDKDRPFNRSQIMIVL